MHAMKEPKAFFAMVGFPGVVGFVDGTHVVKKIQKKRMWTARICTQ